MPEHDEDYGKLVAPGVIEFNRRFDASIERVWQFLVDGEKRKLWFCGGHTDDHVGGRIVLEFDHSRIAESEPPEKYASEDVAQHEGEVLEYDPPRVLAFTWFESASEQSSTVRIVLSEAGDGVTNLHLVHKGVEGREMQLGVLAGWHGHFDLMGEVLVGERKTDFWIRDQQLEAEYAERI